MHKVMKHSNCFHSRFFEENNLLLLTKLGYDQTIATADLSVAQGKSVADHAAEQTSKYNIKYMKDIMPVVRVALALQRGDIESCVNEVRQIAETYEHGKVNVSLRFPANCYRLGSRCRSTV
jgi:nitrogen regulatory protein PII